MIGNKYYMPRDSAGYKQCAEWCNRTQNGRLQKVGDHFECVANVRTVRPVMREKLLKEAVREHLLSAARSKDYDSVDSCVSYRYSTNALWQAEAEAMAQYRDTVWAKYYELVSDGNDYTKEQLIAELPVLEW